ncbi:MAG: Gfo/Idh/MocA family oxidoreductase [Candidatus Omnitrophota bacterium]|nr:Gfo/Idh/MocA family oxidoreductase [Candidatus Omnitrophota bacterium]MDZ4241463.1 Gfo/Idh/MocA family oxidoreductase [Candidatus Omnitrophota bacterium]
MVTIGVIGAGHWGPNHIRIFNQTANSRVAACADLDAGRLKSIKALYPQIAATPDYREILTNPDIQAVCVATPTNTHFKITKEALEHDKHVLCEKPLALTPEECRELKAVAERRNRWLMVGHIFLFNPGIKWLKEYIQSGELGEIQYAHSERTNLGPFRYDVNALWDLAPHDISIFNYLFDAAPVNVSARGQKCLGTSQEDLAFVSMEYPPKILANIHVSWLDPKKVRQITIVGNKKMVVWDDLDNAGPIKLFDKHVEKTATFYETYGEFQLLSRVGSITIPNIELGEPLKAQAQYFIQCIEKNQPPLLSDAQKGHDVVMTLCAAQKSIEQNGAPVDIR